ncbi:hypothetical protein [Echinimonas agarilytica]|uniref:Phosphoenolpyruvate carboxylase n=1 Tax=Echinimonas agarilytica TaxID=1215918 RepID=A0AA41W6Q7_9GAMM|nr:hypothetical protein [Echinimonas agarilytica]MCM2679589.1 hypothetical protein [Echinimonas agarilytica]
MSQPLHAAGVKLLKALSNHSDIIMKAYLSGHISEIEHSPQVIENLIQLGVLWRPEPSEDLRLRRAVRAMLESSLRDDRNRQVDANIGSRLSMIKTLAEHYKEALHHHKFTDAEVHLEELTEQTYGLAETLKSSVRSLWNRIHNEFGYVASVKAKIRENQLAQSQVTDMLNQLEMLDFEELTEIAGGNRELRRLLVNALHRSHSDISLELSTVQSRLIELLGQFREYLGRSQLLKGFALHMAQKPDYKPREYSQSHQVPSLFNRPSPMLKPAQANVNNSTHELELQTIVARLKQVTHNLDHQDSSPLAQTFVLEPQASIALDAEPLKAAVEDYFCQVIDGQVLISALSYHQQQQLPFEQEVWIYAVMGGFQGLSAEEQHFFEMGTQGHPHAQFNGNYIIEDVHLGLR